MSVSEEMLGRRGGHPQEAVYRPEFREASFQPSDGEMGLHKTQPRSVQPAIIGRANEQPWHRMAAHMMIAGRTNKEIAAAAGKEPVTVSCLRSQVWFQELLAKLIAETGASIQQLIQAEAVASLQKLVELRDGAESQRVQYAAAKDLLEYANGKAVQHVVTANANFNLDPQQEMDELKAALAALRQANESNI